MNAMPDVKRKERDENSDDNEIIKTKRRKMAAERSKKYRQKQKENAQNNKNENSTKSDPVSHVERLRNYRERLKQRRAGNIIDSVPMNTVERSKNYRERVKQRRAENIVDSVPMNTVERSKNYRERVKQRKTENIIDSVPMNTVERSKHYRERLKQENIKTSVVWLEHFMQKKFHSNTLDAICCICDRFWWTNEVSYIKKGKDVFNFISQIVDVCSDEYIVCKTCHKYCDNLKIPLMSKYNGFKYPDIPNDLSPLDPISERLISPRLPFLSTRQIRWFPGAKKLVGQIINVPVDVDNMVCSLPRELDDDCAINVNIKRHKLHKSNYLEGCVKKSTVKAWMRYLLETPLYKKYNIALNEKFFDSNCDVSESELNENFPVINDGDMPLNVEAETMLSMQQHTLIWGEEMLLVLFPTHNKRPLALSFDGCAEELSFPAIYYGHEREFKIHATPYSMASSEIRRADRRGAKPDHILYMAAKIMRLRIIDGFRLMFKNKNSNEVKQITRSDISDPAFVQDVLDRNLSFFKGIPNSVQYWQNRKKDLFAMLRQLGKPDIFLTLSASEIHWLPLLRLLLKFRNADDNTAQISDQELCSMSSFWRATIVNDDPVVCCLYFEKFVDVLFTALKNSRGPFGKYVVIDYFKRIEFQHRGSPHAHCLLWLKNAPKENLSEDMPQTIEMIDQLISVCNDELPTIRSVQTHVHTHTCYRKNSRHCRFNAPFMPMDKTRILIPVSDKIPVKVELFRSLQQSLEKKVYLSYDDFLLSNLLDNETYLDVIRHGIVRPTVFFKRDVNDVWTNPYNKSIVNVLNSNMDIQYILDEYSCAMYVAEYVNKSNRGFSSLHRELIKLKDEFPDADFDDLMKEMGKKTLNNVEMSTQEAAWFLLRLAMSRTSRNVQYIPTQHPSERFVSVKTKKQMDEENVDEASTDIWNENVIQYYERRPTNLNDVCLADFVALYTRKKNSDRKILETSGSKLVVRTQCNYEKRGQSKILRWRGYDSSDKINYIRELVTLFHPFRNEEMDILNDDKYLQLFEINSGKIAEARARYDCGFDVTNMMNTLQIDNNTDNKIENDVDRRIVSVIGEDNVYARAPDKKFLQHRDDSDIDGINRISVVQKVQYVMSHRDFCLSMFSLNQGQYNICLELINRLIYDTMNPMQIFFTGPAGSGKSFVLKLMMDILNRFTIRHDSGKCAYLVCATTGKAAVNIDGTTVHTALNIPINANKMMHIKPSVLHSLRFDMREVSCIIIDEISMMSYQMLCNVDYVLRAVGPKPNDFFGGFHVVLCGDLRQLPPVRAAAVYKRPPNFLQRDMIWQNLEYYTLTDVMRQADVSFSSILTKIGNGEKLKRKEISILNNRFVDADSICHMREAVRLFHRNQDVNDYNFNVLNVPESIEITANDEIKGCDVDKQIQSTRKRISKLSVVDTANMPNKLLLLLNTPYILTQNIDKKDKLVNGSFGYLRYIEYDEKDTTRVKRLWIEFNNTYSGAIRRLETAYHATTLNISKDCTPIVRRSGPVNVGSKIIKVKRTQFPLMPANALTVHKSQGGTYDTVVFEYSKMLPTSLVYVGLSRATSLNGLYLTNKNKDHNFYHINDNLSYKELKTEFQRLESKNIRTTHDKASEFFCCEEVKISYMNVQSLSAHVKDVIKDCVFQTSDILALSETWVGAMEDVNINGYKCIAKYKRANVTAGGVAIYGSINSSLTECKRVDFDECRSEKGDVCCARMITAKGAQFCVVAVYASCDSTLKDLQHLIDMALWRFGDSVKHLSISKDNNLSQCPVVLCGDFNIDANTDKGRQFIEYAKHTHNVDLLTNSVITNRSGTSIDYVFTKGVTVDVLPYVSYFSTHRPILCKVSEVHDSVSSV